MLKTKEERKVDQLEFDVPYALRYWREKKGMTQGDICRATGYERTYISKIEVGKVKQPKLELIEILCRVMGVDLMDFINVALKGNPNKRK